MPESETALRLHRFIAQCGVTSRRKAEEMIVAGRVSVDGKVVVELGTKVAGHEKIEVDGVAIEPPATRTVVLNKPAGVITTLDDPQGRPTVASLIPSEYVGMKPVGRLDFDTEGVLLFTNDGDLAWRLTHPRFKVEKEYVVHVDGHPSDRALERLRNGVHIEGKKTAPAQVEVIHKDPRGRQATLQMILREGRKRQVKLMCDQVGHTVTRLKRVRFAFLTDKGMASGECRLLGQQDVRRLRQMVGLEPK